MSFDLRELSVNLLRAARTATDPHVARRLREDAQAVLADERAATFRRYASEVGRRNVTLEGYREFIRARHTKTTEQITTTEQADHEMKESLS